MGIQIRGIKFEKSNVVEITILYEVEMEFAIGRDVPHGLATSPLKVTVKYSKKLRNGVSRNFIHDFEFKTRQDKEEEDELRSLIGEKVLEIIGNDEIGHRSFF
jgi:hypothetical protein